MCIWVIVNQKGGVGKIIIIFVFGCGLVVFGYCVLLIDLDLYVLLICVFGVVFDLLLQGVLELFVILLAELFVFVYVIVILGLDYVCVQVVLVILECCSVNQFGFGLVLQQVLIWYYGQYDYILFDCVLMLGLLMINVLVVVDCLIIFIQVELLVLYGLDGMVWIGEMVECLCCCMLLMLILLMLFDCCICVGYEIVKLMQECYGQCVWEDVIFVDICICNVVSLIVLLQLDDYFGCGLVVYCCVLEWILVDDVQQMECVV